jgi:endonuclease YncB( thermonuclease family)
MLDKRARLAWLFALLTAMLLLVTGCGNSYEADSVAPTSIAEVQTTDTSPSPEPLPTEAEADHPEADVEQSASELGLTPAQVLRVIDGDTIVVIVNGAEERVRFVGIDSPERGAAGFDEATDFTQQAITAAGGNVYLAENGADRDRFDRLRRDVWLGVPETLEAQRSELLLNQMLLEAGHAVMLGIGGADDVSEDSADTAQPVPETSPEVSEPDNPNIPARFRNCTHVWEVLGRPILAGERGFHSGLDRDNDGVGCESRPR